MYYLINNDSDLSFAQQIAIADTYCWLSQAKQQADRRTAATGDSWVVVKIEEVYAPQVSEQEA
jgi:hypothetical protein|tara:strand:+ start:425 stop:613 length:189 start_codon:yes stop_codon:yes gene_type:complete